MMVPSSILPAIASGLLFAASATADKDYDKECVNPVCWGSMKPACEGGPWYCSFNDSNSYPEFDRKDQDDPRRVIIDDDLEFEWRDFDKSHPVRLTWHWWTENETDPTKSKVGIMQPASIKWDKNISDATATTINFWKMIRDDFPNEHTNLTFYEVLGRVQNEQDEMVLGVSQPESPKYKELMKKNKDAYPDYDVTEYSSTFKLSNYNGEYDSAERYYSAQYARGSKSADKKWKLGVGIGVGLGVPIFTAFALFVGYKLGQKSEGSTKVASDTAS